MTKGFIIHYSKVELGWIKKHRKLPRREAHYKFCKTFKRKDVSLENYKALCTRNGWATGRTGCFDKGAKSWNTGKKMPPGRGGNHPNARKTHFKKGQLPHNANYLGHERISKDGYIEISIDEENPYTGFERRYQLKHKYLWELKNGKLPDGMCLKCLDGNRQNTAPDNWEAIPRGALPFLNGHRGRNYEEMPDQLKPSVLAMAKLKYAKSKLERTKGSSTKEGI